MICATVSTIKKYLQTLRKTFKLQTHCTKNILCVCFLNIPTKTCKKQSQKMESLANSSDSILIIL